MKRIVALLLCGMLLLLAGCSGEGTKTKTAPLTKEEALAVLAKVSIDGQPSGNRTEQQRCFIVMDNILTSWEMYKADHEGAVPKFTSLKELEKELVPAYTQTMPECPDGGTYTGVFAQDGSGMLTISCSIHGKFDAALLRSAGLKDKPLDELVDVALTRDFITNTVKKLDAHRTDLTPTKEEILPRLRMVSLLTKTNTNDYTVTTKLEGNTLVVTMESLAFSTTAKIEFLKPNGQWLMDSMDLATKEKS